MRRLFRTSLGALVATTAVATIGLAPSAQARATTDAVVHLGCSVASGRRAGVDLSVHVNPGPGPGASYQVYHWKYNTDSHFLADRVDIQFGDGPGDPDVTWFAKGGTIATKNDVANAFDTDISTSWMYSNSGDFNVQLRVWDASSSPGKCVS
jgi:hypothetical protein